MHPQVAVTIGDAVMTIALVATVFMLVFNGDIFGAFFMAFLAVWLGVVTVYDFRKAGEIEP